MRLFLFKGCSFLVSYFFAILLVIFLSRLFFSKMMNVLGSDSSSEEGLAAIQTHSEEFVSTSASEEPIFFLQKVFHYFHGRSKASSEFWSAIVLSLKLASFSAIVSLCFCWILLQVHQTWPSTGGSLVWALSLFLSSVPALFLGPLLIYVFCFQFDTFSVVFDDSRWMTWILPGFVMASRPCGLFLRFWMVRVHKLRQATWVQYFQSMGISQRRIEEKFLSREIMIPLMALMPQLLMNLFSGSLIVEWLFSVPGVGREMKLALETRNHSLFVALLLVIFSVSFTLRHFFRSLSFRMDPRSREMGHL